MKQKQPERALLTLTGINRKLSKETLTKMGVDFDIHFSVNVENQNGTVRLPESDKWLSTLFFTFEGNSYRDA